jgi:hypothetical protein
VTDVPYREERTRDELIREHIERAKDAVRDPKAKKKEVGDDAL